jgi:purine-binding chemotaxis protein CheW
MTDFSRLVESLSRKSPLEIAGSYPSRVLLVFQLSDQSAAFRLEDVERIMPMAELASPPGLPSAVEGILNLAGVAIPVLRVDRLFGLPAQRLGLYSTLIILRSPRDAKVAILVDRVSEVLPVPENAFLPMEQEGSFNGCTEAMVAVRDVAVPLLSPSRLLMAKERTVLSEFQTMAQRRLQEWRAGQG